MAGRTFVGGNEVDGRRVGTLEHLGAVALPHPMRSCRAHGRPPERLLARRRSRTKISIICLRLQRRLITEETEERSKIERHEGAH